MSLSEHSLILKNDGTLWNCGCNDYGELGLGDTTSRTIFTEITDNVDDTKTPSITKIYIEYKKDN